MITNIQRYGIHDGGGIRTVVFFKGCPLTCKWCHNPETQDFNSQGIFYEERCRGCSSCRGDKCPYNARETVGREIKPKELADIISRDMMFYDYSNGGATLSGGEPLAQDPDYIGELLGLLKRAGIPAAIDTCGEVPWEHMEQTLKYSCTYLYDFKVLDPGLHREMTGSDNGRILDNLERLCASGADVRLRVPVIGGVNDGDEMERMAVRAAGLSVGEVSLLPYHDTGSHKWTRLGMEVPKNAFYTPDEKRMEELAQIWKRQGFNKVMIGG